VINLKEINLAEVLAAKRREKGVTQDEIAAYIGVSKASVSKWETGISLPDIALLPVLASYFDISIDTLIGYAPQLDNDEIKRIYSRMSDRFAESPFEDVIDECQSLVKKYYSCYPFLLEVAKLYINHAPLAGSAESKNELLQSTIKLCNRIKTLCQDTSLASKAVIFQAMCYLLLGEAQRVLETLGDTVQPHITGNMFISQAHQILGNHEKAKEVIQTELYQNIMGVFGGLLSYVQTNVGDYDTALKAFNRAEVLSELFQMRQLNPNNLAMLYVSGAHMYQVAGKYEEAIEALAKYVDVCVHDFFPIKLKGDTFFDKIDGWLKLNSDTIPRSDAVIKESMLNDVLFNPLFSNLSDYPEYNKLVRKLQDFIGGK